MLCRTLLVIGACLVTAACGSTQPPTPSPPGSGTETITGRERIGWDQRAGSTAELTTFRYAIYVDNLRSELADVTCGGTPGNDGYPCSARMPAMSNGSHVLEIASFVAGSTLESERSQPLRVTVTGLAPGAASPLANADTISTADGVELKVELLAEGLRDPGALAIAPDGRAFVGTADGLLMLHNGKALGPVQLADGVTLAIDVSPDFAQNGHVFVTQAVPAASGRAMFRTSRVRDMGGWLADRVVILEHGPASAAPSAALGFAPDGKLHLAFDDGGSQAAADRMSEWRGKLLRMEADGRTPADQAAASPVLWRGLASPRGFDWAADGTTLWLAEASRDGVERLRVIVSTATEPRRASQAVSYVLPKGIGAAGVAFYRGDRVPEFTGDLFVAGGDGGYLLRIRFDDQGRPMTTEKLLEGRPVRAVRVGPDGAMYVFAGDALVRLARAVQ